MGLPSLLPPLLLCYRSCGVCFEDLSNFVKVSQFCYDSRDRAERDRFANSKPEGKLKLIHVLIENSSGDILGDSIIPNIADLLKGGQDKGSQILQKNLGITIDGNVVVESIVDDGLYNYYKKFYLIAVESVCKEDFQFCEDEEGQDQHSRDQDGGE